MIRTTIIKIIITLVLITHINCYVAPTHNLKMLGRWCCLNEPEYAKCNDWMLASNQTDTKTDVVLECIKATDKFDCFKKIFEDKADLMSADAGEVYTAGKYYNLLPISSEIYSSGITQPEYSDYYAVAVVKKNSGMSINTLQGSNSCHGGVGTSSGWNMPISTLIEKQLLEIVDCNNHVKAATKFFNKMCAPDALNVQFNPTGDNPTSACDLCAGKIGSNFCTNQDPYAGTIGALYCLIDGGGDVAFVKHTSIAELIAKNNSINANDFELLCPNVYGSPFNSPGNVTIYPTPTAPISDYMACNWGVVPGRAIITSSRKALVQRKKYRQFLKVSAQMFSSNSNNQFLTTTSTTSTTPFNFLTTNSPNDTSFTSSTSTYDFFQQNNTTPSPLINFNLFDSVSYNGRDLLFLDQTANFKDLDDQVTYMSFLRKFKVTT
jgi:melanoma-associated antigen p97